MIIAGVVIFLVGLAKLRSSQTGVYILRNFGFNIGSTNTQSNKIGNIDSNVEQPPKLDWIGLAATAFGLLTAVVGLINAWVESR